MLKALQGFVAPNDFLTSEGKSQKTQRVAFHDAAFVLIDRQFERFQKAFDVFLNPLAGLFCFNSDDKVIRVTGKSMVF